MQASLRMAAVDPATLYLNGQANDLRPLFDGSGV